jgi:hypothetical protein
MMFVIVPFLNLTKVISESQITIRRSCIERETVFNISPDCLRLSQFFSGPSYKYLPWLLCEFERECDVLFLGNIDFLGNVSNMVHWSDPKKRVADLGRIG